MPWYAAMQVRPAAVAESCSVSVLRKVPEGVLSCRLVPVVDLLLGKVLRQERMNRSFFFLFVFSSPIGQESDFLTLFTDVVVESDKVIVYTSAFAAT